MGDFIRVTSRRIEHHSNREEYFVSKRHILAVSKSFGNRHADHSSAGWLAELHFSVGPDARPFKCDELYTEIIDLLSEKEKVNG